MFCQECLQQFHTQTFDKTHVFCIKQKVPVCMSIYLPYIFGNLLHATCFERKDFDVAISREICNSEYTMSNTISSNDHFSIWPSLWQTPWNTNNHFVDNRNIHAYVYNICMMWNTNYIVQNIITLNKISYSCIFSIFAWYRRTFYICSLDCTY